jgi:hypothetical protein
MDYFVPKAARESDNQGRLKSRLRHFKCTIQKAGPFNNQVLIGPTASNL